MTMLPAGLLGSSVVAASSANLGPGFDTFALALEKPSDRIHLRSTGRGEISVTIREVTGLRVPASAD